MANFIPGKLTPYLVAVIVLVGGLLSLSQTKEQASAPDEDRGASADQGANRTKVISSNSTERSLKLEKNSHRAGRVERPGASDRKANARPSPTATPEPGDPYLGESLVGIEPGFDPAVVFSEAGREFGVPENLLKAVAFVESRMEQRSGALSPRGGRGIMGLRETDAADTLGEAAGLLDTNKRALVLDPAQNVRGAAALLKAYHDEALASAGDSAAAWQIAVSRYSGLPADDAVTYGQHIMNILREGMEFTTTDGAVVTIPADRQP